MCKPDWFSPGYMTARQRFREAVRRFGWTCESHSIGPATLRPASLRVCSLLLWTRRQNAGGGVSSVPVSGLRVEVLLVYALAFASTSVPRPSKHFTQDE